MSEYSLSDMAAVNGGGGFGGNMFFWIFALLLLPMLAGGGLWGARGTGEFGQYATAASQQQILFGQQFQNIDNKLDRLGNGIADATYALTNTVVGEGRNLQGVVGAGFSETIRGIDGLKYDNAMQTQKILDAISKNRIDDMQNQINLLQLQAAMCGVVRYPQAMTYVANGSPFCNYNGGGCGCGAV